MGICHRRRDATFGIDGTNSRFNRHQGVYADFNFTPEGEPISREEWERRRTEWLPTQEDKDYVHSLMKPVHERGKIANWISPPARGVDDKPWDFEYVKFH